MVGCRYSIKIAVDFPLAFKLIFLQDVKKLNEALMVDSRRKKFKPKVFHRKISETENRKFYKFVDPRSGKIVEVPFSILVDPNSPCPEKYKSRQTWNKIDQARKVYFENQPKFLNVEESREYRRNAPKHIFFTEHLIEKYLELTDDKRLDLYCYLPKLGVDSFDESIDFEDRITELDYEDQSYIDRKKIIKYAVTRDIDSLAEICFKVFNLKRHLYILKFEEVCIDSKVPEGSFRLDFVNRKNPKDWIMFEAWTHCRD
jgi:hypothetical protein